MQVQLTNAGAALLNANTGPITLTTCEFGSGVNYIPEPTATGLQGTELFSTAPTAPVAVNANIVVYSVYVDYTAASFSFGEFGLFTEDGTLFAIGANTTLINKIQQTSETVGNSLRLDVYLSMVSTNYAMWLNLAESDNGFRCAVLTSIDQLPQAEDATPNMYIVAALSQFQSAFIAYTDRNALWAFDAYSFASGASATISAFDSQSVTIPVSQYNSLMAPGYLGQVILQFTSGVLYSTCRYVSSAVVTGDTATLGFDNPIMLLPNVNDTVTVYVRQIDSTELTIPIATTSTLGGVIVGEYLTVNSNGVLSINTSALPYPVTSVSGQTGAVVVQAENNNSASGTTLIADSGATDGTIKLKTIVAGTNITLSADANSNLVITNSYSLPVATTTVLGGVKAPTSGIITIAGDGTLGLGFSPVTSVNGQTGAVTLDIPAAYTLPAATTSALGGIIVGTGLTVNGSGVLSATGSTYTLPVATSSVLGGVKIGANVTVAGDGTISVAAPYALPNATTSSLGGVIVGSGLSVSGGVLSVSAVGGVTSVDGQTGAVTVEATDNNAATGTTLIVDGGSTTGTIKLKTIVAGTGITLAADTNGNLQINGSSSYTLPAATTSTLGGVIIGSGINVSAGTISVTPYTLPDATTSVLGGVIVGSGINVSSGTISVPVATTSTTGTIIVGSGLSITSGVLSATATGGVTTFNTRSGAVVFEASDLTAVGGATTANVAAAKYYDIVGGAAGQVLASQIVCLHVAVRTITLAANFAGSAAYAGTAPTAATSLNVLVAGTSVGTISFAAGSQTATFTTVGGTAVTINPAQIVEIVASATADTTFANAAITLLGVAT